MKKKAANEVINNITEDFEKTVAVTKSKELKRYAKNILQIMKNTQSEIKPIKMGKRPGTTYCSVCKDFTHNFRPQEVKMTNEVIREKSNCVACWSNKSRFLKQKHNNKK